MDGIANDVAAAEMRSLTMRLQAVAGKLGEEINKNLDLSVEVMALREQLHHANQVIEAQSAELNQIKDRSS
jgi:regulator of replication initiation timing